jgi:hypothetical protein
MAAPAPTVRQTPSGVKLRNGYRTLITFSIYPEMEFWEKDVTPTGFDGGDKIDQTTMWNTRMRTYSPRALVEQTDCTLTVAYDPLMYNRAQFLINIPMTITTTFSDGSTYAAYGWMKSFEPTEHVTDGEQPEAEMVICFSSEDHNAGWAEQVGILASVSGT